MEEERKAKIRAFLGRYFRHRPPGDDENIFERGVITSLLAMQLVAFLEKEFQIRIEDQDLEMENFSTVNNIARLVGEKRSPVR